MEMRLRDHTQPCEHTENAYPEDEKHGLQTWRIWKCRNRWCPGGREITLRRFDIAKSRDMHLLMRESEAWVEVIDEMV